MLICRDRIQRKVLFSVRYIVFASLIVLTPGVILGISTVIFWRDVADWTGADSVYNGMFLSTLGQSMSPASVNGVAEIAYMPLADASSS